MFVLCSRVGSNIDTLSFHIFNILACSKAHDMVTIKFVVAVKNLACRWTCCTFWQKEGWMDPKFLTTPGLDSTAVTKKEDNSSLTKHQLCDQT